MKKKILIIIIFFVLMIINVHAVDYRGDVDGNGKIGTNDYVLIRKHLLGTNVLTGDKLKRADTNNDNKITSVDYVLVRKMIISGESPKPIETSTPTTQYTVKYYDTSIIETGLNSLTLSGSVSVPVIESKNLGLSVNTLYVVSFDYKNFGGTNKFNIDLYPDSLPEISLSSTTTNAHYDWEVSSNNNDIKNCRLRFFDSIQEANEKDIVISNILMGTVRKDTKKQNETLGILPTPTRSGYKFIGWYTSNTGGTKVSSDTKVTGNMTLYPRFEKISKVLPETYVIPSGYSNVVGKSYTSDTLKYKTIKSDSDTRYYSLIWVKNAYKQLNSANDNLNGGKRVTLLSKEVSAMGYANKGLISTNGSFTWDTRANIPVIATKGNIVNNDRYVIQKKDGTPLGYATLAMGSNNLLTYKDTTNVTEARNWISSIGARNTWAITLFETSNWNSDTDGGEAYRTAICQIDENNFVLYVGHSYGTHAYINELHNMFDCKIVVNLDGGGSTGMYYKTKSMSDVSIIYQRQVDNRSIGDMLYFVEE